MRRIGVVILVLCAAVVACVAASVDAQEREGIDWQTDLVAARTTAAEKGRPLMVVFR